MDVLAKVDAELVEERFRELKRAQGIIDGLKQYRESLVTCRFYSTPAMRARIRELADPPRDDFDRAVLSLLEDFERLTERVVAPISKD